MGAYDKHVGNLSQHVVFGFVNIRCSVRGMNLGKRIEAKLAELGWRRNDLLDRVPGLTAQALSNLIRRDSKRSEWDVAIATALRMSVMDLVYGPELVIREPGTHYALDRDEADEALLLAAYRRSNAATRAAMLNWARSVLPDWPDALRGRT